MSSTSSSFFIQSDSTVKACGYNSYSQLGLGDTNNRSTPVLISGLSNIKQISDNILELIKLLIQDGSQIKTVKNNIVNYTDNLPVDETKFKIYGMDNLNEMNSTTTELLLNQKYKIALYKE